MSQRLCEHTPINRSTRSDEDLIEDVIAHDDDAFAELMARYKAPLYRFILRYAGSPSDAEEILQDTFVSVYSKAARYDPAWKFSTWVYRIALNKCRDYARRLRMRRLISLNLRNDGEAGVASAPQFFDPRSNIEDVIIHRQELHRLESAMQDLPHNMRSAIVLHLVEGRPQSECSEILGVSRKGVEMLVYRARQKLRHRLGMPDEH